jgi:excisionase family DNA binding protein
MEELFTVVEGAERLKVPQRTVKRWLVSGQLRGLKAGRKWRVNHRRLKSFYSTQKIPIISNHQTADIEALSMFIRLLCSPRMPEMQA